MEYDEFQLLLQPSIQPAGQPTVWTAEVRGCPIPALISSAITMTPTLTSAQLSALRAVGFVDLAELRNIGETVWSSIMPADVSAAFKACSNALTDQRGMRLIVTVLGSPPPNAPDLAAISEAPFEALYNKFYDFIGLSEKTPISRRLLAAPDRDPLPVRYPLRILVVAASPTDQMPASIDEEKAVVLEALKDAIDNGIVHVEFCEPPTRAMLLQKLTQEFHVIHFIGHGGFETVGMDPTPVPHLCFEMPVTQDGLRPTDTVDAETLRLVLNGRQARLVVLTACSTAALSPSDVKDYPLRAYDGIAQILLTGNSTLSAVVAMQFDLDSPSATVFSRSFYSELLKPGTPLDIVVYRARRALAGMFDIGRRSWVTPVLYWRCKEGQVFDIAPITGALSSEALQRLAVLETKRETFEEALLGMDNESKTNRDALKPLRNKFKMWLAEIEDERAQLLGETLRVRGGTAQPGEQIDCRVSLRLRNPGKIGAVEMTLTYPSDLTFVGIKPAAGIAAPLSDSSVPSQVTLRINSASSGAVWEAGEHDLCFLTFTVKATAASSYIKMFIPKCAVERDGLTAPMGTLEGVIAVDFPETG